MAVESALFRVVGGKRAPFGRSISSDLPPPSPATVILYCSSHRVGGRFFPDMEIRLGFLNHTSPLRFHFSGQTVRFFPWFIRIGVSINCLRATVCVDQ